ncbi:MAG: hypothetical protein AB7N65_14115 [Vicinamibacterales bacterium]
MARRPVLRPAPRTLRAAVDAAFQAYAERGVFRGFSMAEGARGLRVYRFVWLGNRTQLVTLAPASRRLVFVALFPGVRRTPGAVAALRAAIRAHATSAVPAHRRLRPGAGKMEGRVTDGDLSLHLIIGAGHGITVVRAALAVVNDLFQLLQECFPEYLVTQLGWRDE